jgi:hypothetical protein
MLYNDISSSQSPDFSWSYQQGKTSEFGGLIQPLGGSEATLQTAVVAMSNWAFESAYEEVGKSTGFTVPLTLNLYNDGPDDSVGSLFYTVTVAALIPWRPEADPASCGEGSSQYLGADGTCHDGSLSTVTFDLAGVAAPGPFIYGLSYNTDSGANPYDSLNFSLSADQPTVGSNPVADTVYLNTSTEGFYSDGGPSGTFRQDQGWWTAYGVTGGAIEFTGTTPEPSTILLFGLGLLGLGARKYRGRH